MNILFCRNPLNPSRPDADFAAEFQAAQNAGFTCEIFDYEKLMSEQNAETALRRVRAPEAVTPVIYRGWMLRPTDYARFYQALQTRNWSLINTPTQYQHAHYLPESYPIIAPHTPRSVWLEAPACFDTESA